MSRTPIQVNVEIKEELEILKGRMRGSSLSYVIGKLIDNDLLSQEYRDTVRREREEDKQRLEKEYVYLGEKRKANVKELQDMLGLESEALTIDFLLEVFWMSDKLDRSIFTTWMGRNKG